MIFFRCVSSQGRRLVLFRGLSSSNRRSSPTFRKTRLKELVFSRNLDRFNTLLAYHDLRDSRGDGSRPKPLRDLAEAVFIIWKPQRLDVHQDNGLLEHFQTEEKANALRALLLKSLSEHLSLAFWVTF